MGTTTKGFIAKDDLKIWDGVNTTFTRQTSSGGTATYNVCDWVGLDVHQGFGTRDDTALSAAVTQAGSSNKVALYLSPGTWSIADDLTITSNLTLVCPPGVTVSVASGKTLTIAGPIAAGPYRIFSGAGTVTISGVQIIHDQWADGSGNAYLPSTDSSIDLGTSANKFKDVYCDTISVTTLSTTTLAGDIDPSTTTQARFDDADYITVAIRDGNEQIIHEVPLSQAFSPISGWV